MSTHIAMRVGWITVIRRSLGRLTMVSNAVVSSTQSNSGHPPVVPIFRTDFSQYRFAGRRGGRERMLEVK